MGKMHCKKPRGVGVRRIKTLSITFSLVMLEFFVRMIYNNCYSVCACSSVDRAPASGAGCVGSIPVRRTKSTSLHCGEVLFFVVLKLFSVLKNFTAAKFPHAHALFQCLFTETPVLKRRRRFRCVFDSRTFVLQYVYSRREQFTIRLRKTQAA